MKAIEFQATNGDTVSTTYSKARDMWAMQVSTVDGGAVHWWATPKEMNAWINGRGYAAEWAQAQAANEFHRIGALISDMPAGPLHAALNQLHCDMSEKSSAVAALGAFDANVSTCHAGAAQWYRAAQKDAQ